VPSNKKVDKLDRPVDRFAGTGSLADKLRKRRIAVEKGDPTGGQQEPTTVRGTESGAYDGIDAPEAKKEE